MKLIDARKDHFRKLAHEQGYRSRASFKLKELNKAYRVIGPGFYVLDLGCAPGGWTQVAVELVGNKGSVMGIDTSYVEEIPKAFLLQGNIDSDYIIDEIFSYFGRKINTVICDLSPQVTGNWSVDHAKQISSNYDATKIMDKVLAFKGNAIYKVFDGEFSKEFHNYLKKKFAIVRVTKPQASRKASSELYYVCLGYH